MPRFTFVQLLELTPENRLSLCRLQSSIAGATGGYMPCLTAPQQRVGEGEGKKKSSFVTQTLPKALRNEIIKEGSSAVHVSYQTVYCFLHNSS